MRAIMTYSFRGLVRHAEPEGVFLSFCPTLKIYSQGLTKADAAAALKGAVELFLVTSYKKGILDRELDRAGLSKAVPGIPEDEALARPGEFVEVKFGAFEEFTFDVPFYVPEMSGASVSCLR